MRWIFSIIFRLQGWKVNKGFPPGIRKAVVVAAPHTSNWDLVYALGALYILGIPVRFTIKKEWMKFPFSLFMKPAGGIAIDRSPKRPGEERRSMVQAMSDLYAKNDDLFILVTPEGTRKAVKEWRTGFWQVAQQAGVPVFLGFVDYGKKEAGIGKVIVPDAAKQDEQMREIMTYYRGITPRHPENFHPDEKYI